MLQEEPNTQLKKNSRPASSSDPLALPKSEAIDTQIALSKKAFATYDEIKGTEELIGKLKEASKAPQIPPEKGSSEYHINTINLARIEKNLPSMEVNLILPNVHAENLRENINSKKYGEAAKILKVIGDYQKPTDPRLTPNEIEYLKDFTGEIWFKDLKLSEQNEILHSIFLDSNPNHTTKESLSILTCGPSFNKLSKDEQQKLVLLATRLGDDTCCHLTAILNGKNNERSVLLDNDFTGENNSPGKTLIENLFQLHNAKLVSGRLDSDTTYDLNDKKDIVVQEFIQEIAKFNQIEQENRGTCAVTVPHHFMNWRCPSEMTRLYTELISKRMCVTKGGNAIYLQDDAIPEDETGRSYCERIFTTALLNDAVQSNGEKDVIYSNEFAGYIKPGELIAKGAKKVTLHRKTGQTTEEYIYTCKSLFGGLDTTIVPEGDLIKEQIEEAKNILRSLETYSKNPDFTAISVRWPSSSTDKDIGNHALLALGVFREQSYEGRENREEERLLFRNPHGSTRHAKGTIFSNGVRVENPKEGHYSIPLKNLNEGGQHELRILMHKQIEPAK